MSLIVELDVLVLMATLQGDFIIASSSCRSDSVIVAFTSSCTSRLKFKGPHPLSAIAFLLVSILVKD